MPLGQHFESPTIGMVQREVSRALVQRADLAHVGLGQLGEAIALAAQERTVPQLVWPVVGLPGIPADVVQPVTLTTVRISSRTMAAFHAFGARADECFKYQASNVYLVLSMVIAKRDAVTATGVGAQSQDLAATKVVPGISAVPEPAVQRPHTTEVTHLVQVFPADDC